MIGNVGWKDTLMTCTCTISTLPRS
ncbi:uncharacterized protein METZ01_LOCUS326382, partial [marine metagenome]